MQIIVMMGKDLRRMLADRRAFVVNLSLPLLLTFIMGLSFGGGFFGHSAGISAIPIALVGNGLPTMLQDQLAQGLTESGFFTVTWTDSLQADGLVRQGDAAAAVVFPPDLVERFFSLEDVEIQLWKDPGSSLKAGIVEEILSRSLAQYQAGEAVYWTLWPPEAEGVEARDAEFWEDEIFSGTFADMWQRFRRDPDDPRLGEARQRLLQGMDRHTLLSQAMGVSTITLSVQDKSPLGEFQKQEEINFFNFFLPGFSVFFLMFSVAAGCRDLHRERKAGTLQRQLLTPIRRVDFILARWLSISAQGVFMLGVLFLVGWVLFRINLGPDPFSLALAVLGCSLAATSVFLVFALLSPSEKVMDNLTTVVILVWAMVGGNFIPLEQMPPWIVSVGRLGFNYWANISFQNIMLENKSVFLVPGPLLVMTVVAVGLMVFNVLVFRIRARRGGLA